MKNIDVCIISWAKTPDLEKVTRKGIDSLLKSEDNIQFNIFVVESNKGVSYNDYPGTETIYTDLPFSYNGYLNLARKQGKAEYVFLANNDLTYEKNWASNIIKEMETHLWLLSASPFCPQVLDKNLWTGGNVFPGTRIRGEIAGWAIFQKRKIYDVIGDLDEDVVFWFSDDIYAIQLNFNNIQHALILNSVVNHHELTLGKTGVTLQQEKINEFTWGQEQKYIKAKQKYIKL